MLARPVPSSGRAQQVTPGRETAAERSARASTQAALRMSQDAGAATPSRPRGLSGGPQKRATMAATLGSAALVPEGHRPSMPSITPAIATPVTDPVSSIASPGRFVVANPMAMAMEARSSMTASAAGKDPMRAFEVESGAARSSLHGSGGASGSATGVAESEFGGKDSEEREKRRSLANTEISLRSKTAWGLMGQGNSGRNMRMSVFEEAALFEHRVTATSFSPSLVLRREFGRGIYGYFIFVEYLMVLNALLGIISSVVYAITFFKQSDVNRKTLSSAFVGLYPAESRTAWLISTIIILALPLVSVFIYPVIHRYKMSAGEDAREAATAGDQREDLATRLVSKSERRLRRAVTGTCFVLLVAAQAGITYALYVVFESSANSTGVSIIIALTNNVLNFVNKYVNKQLTVCEKHRKVTTHREADTIKLFTLKFINVIVLYIVKAFVVKQETGGQAFNPEAVVNSCPPARNVTALFPDFNATSPALPAAPPAACNCPLLSMGTTFLWLLIFDVAFSVVVEPMSGLVIGWYRKSIAHKAGLSDGDTKQEFDIAEELVSVLYRQFIILLGAPVFPTITAMGFVAYVIEYYMDRLKLVNLCRKGIIREEPLDLRLTVVCTVLVCAAAAFMYPQGLLFIMLGIGNNVKSCAFFV